MSITRNNMKTIIKSLSLKKSLDHEKSIAKFSKTFKEDLLAIIYK